MADQSHRSGGSECQLFWQTKATEAKEASAHILGKRTEPNVAERGGLRAILGERTEPKWAKFRVADRFGENKPTEVKEAFWQTKATG